MGDLIHLPQQDDDERYDLWNQHVEARKALVSAAMAVETSPERYYEAAAAHLAECEARFVETYTALHDYEEMTEEDEEPADG